MSELGTILHGLGTVAIGWMALRVHRLVGDEQRIDRRVVGAMHTERAVGYAGLVLIVAGVILEVSARQGGL